MGKKSHTLAQSILLRSTYCSFLIPDSHKKCHQHTVQVSETALTSGTAPKSDSVVGLALRPNPNSAQKHFQKQRLAFRGNPL